jgi:hypothetical protein
MTNVQASMTNVLAALALLILPCVYTNLAVIIDKLDLTYTDFAR